MPPPTLPTANRLRRWRRWAFVAALAPGLGSCVTVAPYERIQLNDADMRLAAGVEETFEHNVEAYREGASGANGGKTGGGCGCN